jgi:hypothetical protein
MLANKMLSLALTLRSRPDLASAVASQLIELADCVRHIENAEVPQHFLAELPAGVTRLDTARRGLRA